MLHEQFIISLSPRNIISDSGGDESKDIVYSTIFFWKPVGLKLFSWGSVITV